MFEETKIQYGVSSSSIKSSDKNIVMSFSLLMRLFEWCHEEAKDDVQMHQAMEKIVAFNDGVNPLTIDCYDVIITPNNMATNTDISQAEELGQQYSDEELSSIGRDYSVVAGEIMQNNGFDGISNSELDSFWKGYNIQPNEGETFVIGDDEECCQEVPTECPLEDEIEQIINMSRF